MSWKANYTTDRIDYIFVRNLLQAIPQGHDYAAERLGVDSSELKRWSKNGADIPNAAQEKIVQFFKELVEAREILVAVIEDIDGIKDVSDDLMPIRVAGDKGVADVRCIPASERVHVSVAGTEPIGLDFSQDLPSSSAEQFGHEDIPSDRFRRWFKQALQAAIPGLSFAE